jgi:uncharacterized protein YggU (UPF0235/DUF167 family)
MMVLRATFILVILSSMALGQNAVHKKTIKKEMGAQRTQSSVAVPAMPKNGAANGELTQLEKDTARTITSPSKTAPVKTGQNQALKVPPAAAKTPAKPKSGINFNYQARTNGHNSNSASRRR